MKGNELLGAVVRGRYPREFGRSRAHRSDVKLFSSAPGEPRITDAVANKLNVGSERVYSNIAMHGNTSSASYPIGLDECVEAGRINDGDLVLMASFGGGVTWVAS